MGQHCHDLLQHIACFLCSDGQLSTEPDPFFFFNFHFYCTEARILEGLENVTMLELQCQPQCCDQRINRYTLGLCFLTETVC